MLVSDIGPQTNRPPKVHGFNSASIIDGEKGRIVVHDNSTAWGWARKRRLPDRFCKTRHRSVQHWHQGLMSIIRRFRRRHTGDPAAEDLVFAEIPVAVNQYNSPWTVCG